MAKKVNKRCPLQASCERKCDFEGHELDCDFYDVNAVGDCVIDDQEEIRQERERKRQEAIDMAEFPDDEDTDGNLIGVSERNVVMLPVDQLYPHPDNPRKDVGDVTELAESIKKNGVLQNLTVIPGHYMTKDEYIVMAVAEGAKKSAAAASFDPHDWFENHSGYTVIIGHRRLAAAKKAGVKEVPCVITNMTPKEQVSTMLTENMQRNDLTVYEQAQGFQMMLDLGSTMDEIAEESGFSKTTVRRRMKLLELDPDKFRKSESRGATLQDYLELEKIDDPVLKNEVLDTIGTANFREKLKSAIAADKLKKRIAAWLADMKEFATEITQRDYVDGESRPMDYVTGFASWSPVDKKVEYPTDTDTVRYYYKIGKDQIDLYRDKQPAPEPTEEELRNREIRAEIEKREKQLKEIRSRHFELRSDFIAELGSAKRHLPKIIWFAGSVIVGDGAYGRNDVDADLMARLLDFELDDNTDYPTFRAIVESKAKDVSPEYYLLACAYASYDDECLGYFNHRWNSGKQQYENVHSPNESLNSLYDFLISLGYEMSDEELAMQNGTHQLLDALMPE